MIRWVITPDIVREASSATGESDAATRATINGAIPSVLMGGLELGSTQAGAERLTQMISDGGYGAETVSGFGHLITDANSRQSLENSGEQLLTSLFGSRTDAVSHAVAQAGGVRHSSASHLMRLIAPLVMGMIGKQISARGLDTRGVMNMLMGERSSVVASLPAGVARALGFERGAHEEAPRVEGERERPREIKVNRRSSFGPALIGALAALALLFFLTRSGRRHETTVTAPPASEIQTPVTVAPAPAAPGVTPGTSFTEIDEYMTGKGKAAKVFILQGITFETNSSTLTSDAKTKVNELATVLKAHPDAEIRIEGHTDNQGNAAENRRLSLDRANQVKAELVNDGVDAGHVMTRGAGGEHPIASNDTEAGRAQNRRTVLVVVKR
jgi:outer membrane protein OmpA-like peptidoglycan-associated protein